MSILKTPIRFLNIHPIELNLSLTLRSGQSFNWKSSIFQTIDQTQHIEWSIVNQKRTIILRQVDSGIHYLSLYHSNQIQDYQNDLNQNTTLTFLNDYFVLNVSLQKLYQEWSRRDSNFKFKTLNGSYNGLRVCKQDPWETLISFICSSNNNIPRITSMINNLSESFGTPMPYPTPGLTFPKQDEIISIQSKPNSIHTFPTPHQLSRSCDETKLKQLGFGYRSSYIMTSTQSLIELSVSQNCQPIEYLNSLSNGTLSYSVAHQTLITHFSGVGPKVSDCICLFGLGFKETVPVDVHLYQIAKRDYQFLDSSTSKSKTVSKQDYDLIKTKFIELWGDYAGWTQQIIFFIDLNHPNLIHDHKPKHLKRTLSSMNPTLKSKLNQLSNPSDFGMKRSFSDSKLDLKLSNSSSCKRIKLEDERLIDIQNDELNLDISKLKKVKLQDDLSIKLEDDVSIKLEDDVSIKPDDDETLNPKLQTIQIEEPVPIKSENDHQIQNPSIFPKHTRFTRSTSHLF